jgi:hypothetical protein
VRRAIPGARPTAGKPNRATSGSDPASALPMLDIAVMRSSVTPQQIATEEGKLLRVEESIRAFVRAADPRFRQVVPMRFFNLILTPAEADAYCEDLKEKNPRSEIARAMLRMVAVAARMTTELEELRRAQNSQSLWRLHADSLVVLLEIGRAVNEHANSVLESARAREDKGEADAIQASLKKLHDSTETVLKTLSTRPAGKVVAAGK